MKKIFFLFVTFSGILSLTSAQNMAPYWSLAGNSNATGSSKMGTINAVSLGFFTSNAERARITASGFVGIGTGTPLSKFHVNGFGSFGGKVTNANATRALNLADVDAVMRILRVHPTNAPALELISRTSADGPNVAYWDLYTEPGDASFRIRDRQNGSTNLNRLTVLHTNGNVGIGTTAPENLLHIFKGSAGSAARGAANAPLIVENSTHSYISILAPDAAETGILFGNQVSNVSGGIVYNSPGSLRSMQFRTNNNQTQMVLTEDGHLGIGTTDPGTYRLKVVHGRDRSVYDKGLAIENGASGSIWELFTRYYDLVYLSDMWLFSNGNFVAQIDAVDGSYSSISDERLKSNINPMPPLLNKIKQLKPSTYQFKNSGDTREHQGFMAQDVMKIFPGLVSHNVSKERNVDLYTVNYSGFGVIAIKGIQELLPIIEEQKVEILTLKDRLVKLEAAMAELMEKKTIATVVR